MGTEQPDGFLEDAGRVLQPELAGQITRALDPHNLPENVTPIRPVSAA